MLIGRSIGTGPVCVLASEMQLAGTPVAAVILQSPYSSIRAAAADLLGCLSYFLLDRWQNWKQLIGDEAHVIKAPVLFIHADADKVIDCNHSILMHEYRLKFGLASELFIQESDDIFIKGHNFFDYEGDVVIPCREFLARHMDQIGVGSDGGSELGASNPAFHTTHTAGSTAAKDSPGTSTTGTANPRNCGIVLSSEVLQTYSSVPQPYVGKYLPEHKLQFRQNPAITKSMKCTRDVWLSWTCCPCSFCCECCFACNTLWMHTMWRWSVGALCGAPCQQLCGISCCVPKFDYMQLRPPEAQKGSCYQIVFGGRAELQKTVQEHDAAQATARRRQQHHLLTQQQHQRRQRSRDSGGSGSGGGGKVHHREGVIIRQRPVGRSSGSDTALGVGMDSPSDTRNPLLAGITPSDPASFSADPVGTTSVAAAAADGTGTWRYIPDYGGKGGNNGVDSVQLDGVVRNSLDRKVNASRSKANEAGTGSLVESALKVTEMTGATVVTSEIGHGSGDEQPRHDSSDVLIADASSSPIALEGRSPVRVGTRLGESEGTGRGAGRGAGGGGGGNCDAPVSLCGGSSKKEEGSGANKR